MRAVILALAMLSLAGACGKGKSTKEAEPSAVAVAAPSPGGPMCKEHGVPESMCTKCNPKLIDAFKAKGDWCEEHGFPESVCPICHPELAGKPQLAQDELPADGAKLCLKSKEAAKKAGLETVKAVERPEGPGYVATATIAFDATRHAVVNARSPGVVRAIKADVGAKVQAGAPLAVIDSAGVGADRSRLQGTRARVSVAEAGYKREKDLHEKGISSSKDVQAAQQEWEAAKAEYASLTASLGVVGQSAGGTGGYTLASPIAGAVVHRTATIGRLVGVEETLFEIVDTSTMWAEIDIPEDQLVAVSVGQAVVLTVDGLAGRHFTGSIAYVSPEVDPHTRTAQARAALSNPDGVLRANMFARARIVVGDGKGATVTIPSAALQREGDVYMVFVRLSEDEFQIRRVDIGAHEDGTVEITKGVKGGEDVVAQGAFLLKTDSLKDSIGAGCADD